jgi:tripartite-type tricarboxylate transporter receptor subunit TctC
LLPAKTPPEVAQRVNAEVMKALAAPEVLERYRTIGVEPVPAHSPEAFASFLRAEVNRWGQVIKDAKVTVE